MYYRIIGKRLCDLILCIVLSLPALLLILICCVAIIIEAKGPVLFIQSRPGYKGRNIRLYKLRTMNVETHIDGHALTDMQRITSVGKHIRAFSFDELPQIWNILKGDMSFIGPRPLLPEYIPLYSSQQMRRHDVYPGISGWAQVNGRNELSWEKKFEQDIWYVEHLSFQLDLKIIWLTIINVINGRGINAGLTETMKEFQGSREDNNP